MEQFCVADLLDIPLMRNARLVCGEHGLRSLISGINIIEAPDVVDWLQGGEVLLTNLYSLKELGSLQAFIEGLSRKRLSALLVKIGVFVDAIPPAMIEAAARCNLPVIEIGRDILYRDIAFAVTERLLNDQVTLLKFFKETHNCFLQLSVNNADTQQIIDALKALIGNPVLIYDRDFSPLRGTDDALLQARPLVKPDETLPYFTRPCVVPAHAGEAPREFDQLVFPVQVIGHVKIYLAVCLTDAPVKEAHHVAIENAVNTLRIEFIKRHAVGEVEKRFHNDLLSDLLSGRIDSADAILERASLLHWDLKKHYAVASFALADPGFADGQKGIERQRLAYDRLHALLTSLFPQSPLHVRTDKLIMLWDLERGAHRPWLSAIREDMQRVWNRWTKSQPSCQLMIGIGDVARELAAFAVSFREAEDTLKIMRNIALGTPINAYPELGVYRLLCQYESRDTLKSFIPHPLHVLMEAKQSARNDLVHTLRVYLECDRSMTRAAARLFLHHKTVAYRLEQIKKCSGLTLNDTEELLQLQLGFKILDVIQALRQSEDTRGQ